MERLSRLELPLPAAPSTCDARATIKSAVMPTPATFTFKFASEATESTSSGQLIVPAESTSPANTDGTLPVSVDASRASLIPPRGPVSASTVVVAVPRAPRTDTRAALASPTTVGAVLSCAMLAAGHASKAIASAIAIKQRLKDSV